ncbi:DUF6544 family protein [Microbacterium koreense]|uniref:DUF6544 family protein n=1 Tax=Microbacterium koreense TaxID=323761 RepID=A0ABW2ZNP6_9MICO
MRSEHHSKLPDDVAREWATLSAVSAMPRAFRPDSVEALPPTAQRWLTASIRPGTPLWKSATFHMRGEIRLRGLWVPFTASQVLRPDSGFIWTARTRIRGIPVQGFDRFANGEGTMRWRLLNVVPVMSASGADVTASARGRLVGEGVLLPTAFDGAEYRPGDDPNSVHVRRTVGDSSEEAQFWIDDAGHLAKLRMLRWGDPDGRGFGRFPFGMDVVDSAEFDGVLVPSHFRAGWWSGTDRSAEGEFFRARLTDVTFPRPAARSAGVTDETA